MDAFADFEGPIKVIPALLKDAEKLEFSDKNPYPGCKASHFFSLQAFIIKSALR